MLLSQTASLLAAFASVAYASPASPPQEVLHHDAAYKHLDLTHDLFAFHKNLTQIESISGNEKEVGEWLVNSLVSQGYHAEKQIVSEDPLRFNVLAWPGSKRDAQVLVSSHIDTVSGEHYMRLRSTYVHMTNLMIRYLLSGSMNAKTKLFPDAAQ